MARPRADPRPLRAAPDGQSRAAILRLTTGGWCVVSTLVLFLGPTIVRAQDPVAAPAPADDRARAIVELDLRLSDLAGRAAATAGIRGLLELRPGLRIGGGFHRVLRRIDDAPDRIGAGLGLSLAHAGGLIEVDIPGVPLSVRLLGGAGIAAIHDAVVGTQVGSDAFGVIQPELIFRRRLLGWASAHVIAGYFFPFQSDGPGRVRPGDLRTPFFGIGLRLGPF